MVNESFNKDLLNCAKYGSYLNIKNKKTYKIEAPKVLIKNSNLSELRAVCMR